MIASPTSEPLLLLASLIAILLVLCSLRRMYVRILVFSLPFVLVNTSGYAQDRQLDLDQLRPKRVGIGGITARVINGFHTPVIYEVHLDPQLVNSLLPHALVPRLDRGTKGLGGKIEKVALKPGFLKRMSGSLRAVNKGRLRDSSHHFHELFEPSQPYNFSLTADRLSFAKTGTGFGPGRVSKHAIISSTYQDIRFAGQLWRQGDTLWFNANSGTYMKKRKESKGLNPAPASDAMFTLLRKVFEPALTVAFSPYVAPYFGSEEALDQAGKAVKAAEKAEAEAARAIQPEKVALLKDLASRARQKAEDATRAAGAVAALKEDAPDYVSSDLRAGQAAYEAREARKEIENLLELDDD